MGLYTALPESIEEVDVIIAGGGTAGCIVAARLAAANPETSILVVESGGDNTALTCAIPALFYGNLKPDAETRNVYLANKTKHVADREIEIVTGGVLGGGSSINALMYSRAQRADYDSWNTPGWSADDMLPYLRKIETYHGPGDKELHGHDGPIRISRGTYGVTRSADAFVKAAGELGWPEIDDLQSQSAINGVQRSLHYICPEGKRQDTASRYLKPRLNDGNHPNLHVLLNSPVVRVLIENKKAVGLEFQPKSVPSEGASLPVRSVRVRKAVVLSCGAFGTPTVLERSGIGSPDILERAHVPLVANIPGVGSHYIDHQLIGSVYKTALDEDQTLDAIFDGRRDVGQLMGTGNGILGWNGVDMTSKLRPTEDEVAALGPKFQKAWERDFKNNPTKAMILLILISTFAGDPSTRPTGQYLGFGGFTAYSYARGHVHITGPNVGDKFDFDSGFLADPDDLDMKKHVWAYKKARTMARRMEFYRGELAMTHPAFPEGSQAACIDIDTQLTDVKDIEYTAEDDAAIERWVRERVGTCWHSAGTAKMAPLEDMGVVDAKLNVHGIEGLKVADLSIMPQNVAANTNNTAMAIGEKAADILIEELGVDRK